MCGIVGAMHPGAQVEQALAELGRGNDGTRVETRERLTLGCRRHAVIAPLATIDQPQESGGILTVANGELFEDEAVAGRLHESRRPGARTDIAIFHRYAASNGVGAVAELDMMMAAAICSQDAGSASLVRDWVGELPLHYVVDPRAGSWCFASTIAGVVDCVGCEASSVAEVPPGAIVELGPSGVRARRYFDVLDLSEQEPASYSAAVDRTRALLEEAARARQRTDVPAAALVSGGIDSLITTWLLLQADPRGPEQPLPLYTFHCSDYPDDERSDLHYARRVAEFFGDRVDHRVVTATEQEILEAVPDVVTALEDLRCRDFNVITGVYNYFLARRLAGDGIKVVFEGEGSDEALGSYSAWGSFAYDDSVIREPGFRRRLVSNLHKGALLRTSKLMMRHGPVECRSFFLSRKVMSHLVSLPADVVQSKGRRKGVLIDAFSDAIPVELLNRPKTRPQDATGITTTLRGRPEIETPLLQRQLAEFFESRRRRHLASASPPPPPLASSRLSPDVRET